MNGSQHEKISDVVLKTQQNGRKKELNCHAAAAVAAAAA